MNYSKVRSTAHFVSFACLILIFIISTSGYVSAGTISDENRTGIPANVAFQHSQESNIPDGTDIQNATGKHTDIDLGGMAGAVTDKIQRTAKTHAYTTPLVKTSQVKIDEAEEARKEAAKKEAEEKAKASQSTRGSEPVTYTYGGAILSRSRGSVAGPSGKETYYNLNMSVVVSAMRRFGYSSSDYWVRSDGAKMLGSYVMVAANYGVHPKGSLVPTSLGTGIVCDTGGFATSNPTQLDLATNW